MRCTRCTVASRWAMTIVVRPLHRDFERRLHGALALRVERGGRLVEQQQWRILEHRACDREALALSSRQAQAALADLGRVALGQALDELVDVRGARRGQRVGLAGIAPAVDGCCRAPSPRKSPPPAARPRCGARRSVERSSRTSTPSSAARRRRSRRSVAAAGKSCSCRRRSAPTSATVWPGSIARSKSAQHGMLRPRRIDEARPRELDAQRRARSAAAARLRADRRLTGREPQQFHQPFGRSRGAQQLAPDLGQHRDAAGDDRDVQRRLADSWPARDLAAQHRLHAAVQAVQQRAEDADDHERGQRGARARAPDRGGKAARSPRRSAAASAVSCV